jgi:hypothetical protein
MRSRITASFSRRYGELPLNAKEAVRRAYLRFTDNPRHPGLQLKRVSRKRPIVSARVSDDYRVLGLASGEEIAWFWVGPHHEYDKLLKRI